MVKKGEEFSALGCLLIPISIVWWLFSSFISFLWNNCKRLGNLLKRFGIFILKKLLPFIWKFFWLCVGLALTIGAIAVCVWTYNNFGWQITLIPVAILLFFAKIAYEWES